MAWTVPSGRWARDWMVELDTDLSHEPGTDVAAGSVVALVARSMIVLRSTEAARTRDVSDLDALRERAVELGVEPFYWDVEGGYHDTPEHTLRAVVDVLEADADPGHARRLPPVIVGRPERIETDRRGPPRARGWHRGRLARRLTRAPARPSLRLPRTAARRRALDARRRPAA